jgi:predicted Rossmann fold flavoprotein
MEHYRKEGEAESSLHGGALMSTHSTDVLIIGGGAAGLMAALAATRSGVSVTIAEKEGRIGKKILTTGNGRCNLSNRAIRGANGAASYNHPAFVASILSRYDCDAVCAVFEKLGLLTVSDGQGWVFPRTRSAHSVLDVLRNQTDAQGVEQHTTSTIEHLSLTEEGLFLATTADKDFLSRTLVLACGVAPILKSVKSHRMVTPLPILGPLKTEQAPLKGLDGVRVSGLVSLLDEGKLIAQESGEILFRNYGISGIAVFNLSRLAHSGQEVTLDFFPEFSNRELESLLRLRHHQHHNSSAAELFDGLLHTRLAHAVLRHLKVAPLDSANTLAWDELAHGMKDYRLRITDGPAKTQAQVTRGGLAVEEFDSTTLQSLQYPRLFAAGECLDVDGPCGGFNLHWAWASGLCAGQSAGELTRKGL